MYLCAGLQVELGVEVDKCEVWKNKKLLFKFLIYLNIYKTIEEKCVGTFVR